MTTAGSTSAIRSKVKKPLEGKRILIVEDQALVAMEIQGYLEEAGAQVAGPAGRVDSALKAVQHEAVNGALLDIDLNGERCWPVADALASRNIPFAFTTGFDADIVLPERFRKMLVLTKPYNQKALLVLLAKLLPED